MATNVMVSFVHFVTYIDQ